MKCFTENGQLGGTVRNGQLGGTFRIGHCRRQLLHNFSCVKLCKRPCFTVTNLGIHLSWKIILRFEGTHIFLEDALIHTRFRGVQMQNKNFHINVWSSCTSSLFVGIRKYSSKAQRYPYYTSRTEERRIILEDADEDNRVPGSVMPRKVLYMPGRFEQ